MIKRPPDRIIGENYLHRWYLVPRNVFSNIMLHLFIGSDDDRACHTHPWWSLSFLLMGELWEVIETGHETGLVKTRTRRIRRFMPVVRSASHAHRLILNSDKALTLFITAPVIQRWGFWCGTRWVHWKDFTDETGNGIGRGCE
jgi:hypothetical protein